MVPVRGGLAVLVHIRQRSPSPISLTSVGVLHRDIQDHKSTVGGFAGKMSSELTT